MKKIIVVPILCLLLVIGVTTVFADDPQPVDSASLPPTPPRPDGCSLIETDRLVRRIKLPELGDYAYPVGIRRLNDGRLIIAIRSRFAGPDLLICEGVGECAPLTHPTLNIEVRGLAVNTDDLVWVAHAAADWRKPEHAGVSVFDPTTSEWGQTWTQTSTGIATLEHPRDVAVSEDGTVWVAGEVWGEGGVARRFPDGTWKEYGRQDGLLSGGNLKLLITKTGEVWVAGYNGLSRYRWWRDSWEAIPLRPTECPDCGEVIRAVVEDPGDSVWGVDQRLWRITPAIPDVGEPEEIELGELFVGRALAVDTVGRVWVGGYDWWKSRLIVHDPCRGTWKAVLTDHITTLWSEDQGRLVYTATRDKIFVFEVRGFRRILE